MVNSGKENNINKCFKYFWTRNLLQDPKYSKPSKEIKKGFSASFVKVVLVTSTMNHRSPDFVVKALSISDKEVDIRHTWGRSENASLVWSGSIALFRKWNDLEQAVSYIVRNLEDVHVLWFRDMINLLIFAESNHKSYDVGFSKIIISGPRSFERHELFDFRKKLSLFGDVKKVKVVKGKTDFGKIASVEYRFATHAFVAKFHLNGMSYGDLGYLHAEIQETDKEKSMRKEVFRHFMQQFVPSNKEETESI